MYSLKLLKKKLNLAYLYKFIPDCNRRSTKLIHWHEQKSKHSFRNTLNLMCSCRSFPLSKVYSRETVPSA